MQFVFALAPSYFIVRDVTSAIIVIVVGWTTYLWVWAHRKKITLSTTFFRNVLLGTLITVLSLNAWASKAPEGILAPAPIFYLLEVCLIVCPLAGILAWIRNGRPHRQN